MLKIEKFLLENGFIQHFFSFGKLTTQKQHTYPSSIGHICCHYIKNNDIYTIGLNEKGLPPTFVSPRPQILVKHEENEKEIISFAPMRDYMVNRLLLKYENNYEAFLIEMKKPVIELTKEEYLELTN